MQEQRFDRAHRRLRIYQSAGLRLPSGGRTLEIGCSTGQFLRALSESGVEAEGIEPSEGFATAGKKEGFTIHEGFYPEVDAIKGKLYDTVFFIHSLEHIPDCGSVLAVIYDQLLVGGQLLVEVPCYEIALHDRKWLGRGYFHDAHLFDFTRIGLVSMLRRNGFIIENEGTGDGARPKNWFVIATRSESRNSGDTNFMTDEQSSFVSLWSYLKIVWKMFPIQGV